MADAKPQSPHVLQGIKHVIAAFAENGIGKNRKNESQGFKFRGIDDVMNRMAQHLVEADLVIVPNIRNREVNERVNSRGNPLFYVTVQVDFTVYSTIDGSSVVCSVPGEAMDSGDKATNKALSIAYKYMAFQLFAIPIDEDPDATTHVVGPKPKASGFMDSPATPATISEDELKIVLELIKQAGVKDSNIAKAYGVGDLVALPQSVLPEVIAKLQSKIKTNATTPA
jgi:hypothetical protein